MLPIHAVGIDLGTTYSCLAYLNEHGEPITIPNRDGELSTPSAVWFDGEQVIVGTEALRHSILYPDRVVMHAKRYMGNPKHRWQILGKNDRDQLRAVQQFREHRDNSRRYGDGEEQVHKEEREIIFLQSELNGGFGE